MMNAALSSTRLQPPSRGASAAVAAAHSQSSRVIAPLDPAPSVGARLMNSRHSACAPEQLMEPLSIFRRSGTPPACVAEHPWLGRLVWERPAFFLCGTG